MEQQTSVRERLRIMTGRFTSIFLLFFAALMVLSLVLACLFYTYESVEMEGRIEPSKSAAVRAKISGTLSEVLVSGGEQVPEGRVLAVFDDIEVRAAATRAELELEISRDKLTQSREELRSLKATNEGKRQDAQLNLRSAKTELDLQLRIWEATKAIHHGDSKTSDTGQEAEEPLELRAKRIAFERAQLSVKNAERASADERIKQAEIASVEKSTIKLEAELESAQSRLAKTEITAPLGGYVLGSDLFSLKGAFVTEGQTLFRIGDLSGWVVKAYVAEDDMPKIRIGQQATLYVRAYPYEEFRSLIGEVADVSNSSVSSSAEGSNSTGSGVKALYAVSVKVTGMQGSSNDDEIRLYDGFMARVKVTTKKDRIVSFLLDKLFSTAGKLKSLPVQTTK